MRSGDHICVDRGSFLDHGIYVSQEQVIHFGDGPLQDSVGYVICSTTLDRFAPGGWNSWVGVVDHRDHPHFSYLDVVQRAQSQLGQHGHDLSSEHFATWCATGQPASSPPHTKG